MLTTAASQLAEAKESLNTSLQSMNSDLDEKVASMREEMTTEQTRINETIQTVKEEAARELAEENEAMSAYVVVPPPFGDVCCFSALHGSCVC